MRFAFVDLVPPMRRGYLAVILLIAACASTPTNQELAFLSSGQVTKEDVISRLGVPSATFEHDLVFTYRLGVGLGGLYWLYPESAKGWEGVNLSLVLVFDGEGLLQRHNVVTVRKP